MSLPGERWVFCKILITLFLSSCPSSLESLWSPVVSIGAAVSALALVIPTAAGVCSTTREYLSTTGQLPPASYFPTAPPHPPIILFLLAFPVTNLLPFDLSSLPAFSYSAFFVSFANPIPFFCSDFTLNCQIPIRNICKYQLGNDDELGYGITRVVTF